MRSSSNGGRRAENDQEPRLETPTLKQIETLKDVVINSNLTQEQKDELKELLEIFKDVMTDVPGRTNFYT
ncbi:hypothetical protein PoB_004575300 [Plakobranchus ocellatus]|uniref:Uncharacterized protein n=1 Tax=Plakobranchus ocellatus TaxID=259542 RepID=A0AAV4BJA3_9GAST|nr:hypothetical protein PoB_004575300 [Plakobranchus ocellatus]